MEVNVFRAQESVNAKARGEEAVVLKIGGPSRVLCSHFLSRASPKTSSHQPVRIPVASIPAVLHTPDPARKKDKQGRFSRALGALVEYNFNKTPSPSPSRGRLQGSVLVARSTHAVLPVEISHGRHHVASLGQKTAGLGGTPTRPSSPPSLSCQDVPTCYAF